MPSFVSLHRHWKAGQCFPASFQIFFFPNNTEVLLHIEIITINTEIKYWELLKWEIFEIIIKSNIFSDYSFSYILDICLLWTRNLRRKSMHRHCPIAISKGSVLWESELLREGIRTWLWTTSEQFRQRFTLRNPVPDLAVFHRENQHVQCSAVLGVWLFSSYNISEINTLGISNSCNLRIDKTGIVQVQSSAPRNTCIKPNDPTRVNRLISNPIARWKKNIRG